MLVAKKNVLSAFLITALSHRYRIGKLILCLVFGGVNTAVFELEI